MKIFSNVITKKKLVLETGSIDVRKSVVPTRDKKTALDNWFFKLKFILNVWNTSSKFWAIVQQFHKVQNARVW